MQTLQDKIVIDNLHLYYGDFHALHGINMNIKEKEITAFIPDFINDGFLEGHGVCRNYAY